MNNSTRRPRSTNNAAGEIWDMSLISKLCFATAVWLQVFLPTTSSASNVLPRYAVGDLEEFWAWDLTVMPPGFRRVEARATSVGQSSYVFVENAAWESGAIDFGFASDLYNRLEQQGLPSSLNPEKGILPLQQSIFGPLPDRINTDPRVVILLLGLGEFNGHRFGGYFNPFDQMTEPEAQNYQQHSNEVNVIYLGINLDGANDTHQVASIITHELQHLLSHNRIPNFHQAPWLSEASAEAAMMFSGYFTDQKAVERYAEKTWGIPLVTSAYVHYGASALFAAFLVDKLGGYGAFDDMMHAAIPSREAVEYAHYVRTGRNTSFDAIFSEFITYVYVNSNTHQSLPNTWQHSINDGYRIPNLTKVATIRTLPFNYSGSLRPYSFAVFELERALPPNARVSVEILAPSPPLAELPPTVLSAELPLTEIPPEVADESILKDCKDDVQILWKPLPNAIAVYSIGCKFGDNRSQLRYKLTIRD